MSLYRCTKCDVVENTACGEYWIQRIDAAEAERPFSPLCSQCLTGTWHGQFPREGVSADWVTDARGFLWRTSQLSRVEHLGPFTPVSVIPDESLQHERGSDG